MKILLNKIYHFIQIMMKSLISLNIKKKKKKKKKMMMMKKKKKTKKTINRNNKIRIYKLYKFEDQKYKKLKIEFS